MKRFLKWFFIILITVAVLLVALTVSLPYIIDPNKYKPQIIAQIKPYMLGRDLKIPGNIKFSIIPWLGVEIGDMVIGNADGFVLKPFMTIKQSRAHIRLLSLLSDTPEIGSLDFNGIVLNLQRDAEGRDNWSDLAGAGKSAEAKPHKTAQKTTPAAAAMVVPNLKIEGIHFQDARINFEDRQSKSEIIVSKLNLDAGPINQLNPIPLKGQFNYFSKTQGINAAAAFATTVVLTPASRLVTLQQFAFNSNISGEVLNNKTVPASLKVPELVIDLASEKIRAKPFHLVVDQMQSDGRLTLRRFHNPIIRLGLDMQELDLDKILPAAAKAEAETAKPEAEAADTSPAIFAALIPLKTADMQGTLNFKKLVYHKLPFENVKINLLARGGLISALPQATLYKGSYEGDVQINVRKLPVHVRSKQQLRNVPMGPITLALTGKESLTGTANIQGQFNSDGNTLNELTSQLNGDAVFNIRNMELTLADVEKLILQKWYDRLKVGEKQEKGKKVTAFDSVRGTIRIKQGIAYNHDFSAVAHRVHLSGSGQANLVKRNLDYTLITVPKTSLAVTINNRSYDLKDKRIPTYIRGPWSNLEINHDLTGALKLDAQGKVEAKKAEAREKLKSKIEEEKSKLQEKLKGVLGR
jgi:AsmA protein